MRKDTADTILAGMRQGYRTAAVEEVQTHERLYKEELERFVDYAREREAVLDVGCGDGRVYETFKAKGVSYAGVDLSDDVIARAKTRWAKELAEGRVAFEAGDLLDLPVEDGRFDVVVAAGVLHHVPSEAYRAKAVAELARAIRPGGYALIAVWNLWQPRHWGVLLHQMFGKKNGWDFGDLKVTWKKPLFPRYYHAFRMKELRNLCEAAGLDVVEQHYVRKGELVDWVHGENLVTVARKRA
ncbi:MAG TPA: methyltransferase domain-containing protein [Candidatus Baltobacteraceae bacterium]|nr:methyltransferase domain-containing protein [Candidatus Baltobacteraceae bacterium]